MADLVRSEAKQGTMPEQAAASCQGEQAADLPLWLVLLARWTSATVVLEPRHRPADLAGEHDGAAFAAG